MSRQSRKIFFSAFLLAVLTAQAGAQQLYISKVNTWFRTAGANGYCSDVTTEITVPVTGLAAGVLSRAIAGTVSEDTDGDGVIDNTYAESVTVAGAYTSTLAGMTGTLNGYDDRAEGNVSGSITAPSLTGNSAGAGAVACAPLTFNTGAIYSFQKKSAALPPS